jgi:hypothetical protein
MVASEVAIRINIVWWRREGNVLEKDEFIDV